MGPSWFMNSFFDISWCWIRDLRLSDILKTFEMMKFQLHKKPHNQIKTNAYRSSLVGTMITQEFKIFVNLRLNTCGLSAKIFLSLWDPMSQLLYSHFIIEYNLLSVHWSYFLFVVVPENVYYTTLAYKTNDGAGKFKQKMIYTFNTFF